MILARRRLLARLGASEPRLVRLCAPPGYGKTDFAGIWARRFDRRAVTDCTGVCDLVDFAGRVMSALADESHGGGDAVARTRLSLHSVEAAPAAWHRALLEAWKARQERALLILENADALAAHPGILALLSDMLAARPVERVLLVISREPLPLDVAQYLAPHQVLTLTREELQLDDAEAAGIFEGTDLRPSTIDRIAKLAGGWPIALVLLARIAHYEANIEPLLDRLDGAADVLDYLLNEVLWALTPDMLATMLAAAAIPQATLEDISVANGIRHAAPIVEGLLRLPGFISYASGAYQVHPLLHSALRARHGAEFGDYVVRAAQGNESAGDFLRAAELFIVAGDPHSAAASLDRLPIEALVQPGSRLIGALASISISTIGSHPNLWMAMLPYRRQNVEVARLYDESVRLQQSISPEASPTLHRRLGVRRAMLARELERLKEARATLESLGPIGTLGETPEEHRLVLMTSAVIAAKQGRFSYADRFVEEADAVAGARHLRFDEERAQIAMEKARLYGDWDDLLKISEERLAAALRSGVTERIVEAAVAVAWAAWYRNGDDRVAAAQQIVKDCGASVEAVTTPAAVADWQAALAAASPEQAGTLLDRAIAAADDGENDFLRIAIRVCAALLLAAQRRRLLEARAIAQAIESPPLQASLELLIDSQEPRDFGIFTHLAQRVGRSPLKGRHDAIYVEVARGQVRRGSELLHVSDRGLELLAALALFDSGTGNEQLAAALWPSLDRKAAVNSLKMCVSRTRAQIGDRESIQNTRNGYALGEHIGSDVRELARLVHRVRGAGSLGESMRRQAEELLAAWSGRRPAHAAGWSWFAPYAAHLADLRRELTHWLAKDASKRERAGAAIAAAM
jgi:hypothetical protein